MCLTDLIQDFTYVHVLVIASATPEPMPVTICFSSCMNQTYSGELVASSMLHLVPHEQYEFRTR